MEGPGFEFRKEQELFLFSKTSRLELDFPRLLFSGNRRSPPRLRQVGLDVYHPSPSRVEIKKKWSYVGRDKVLLLLLLNIRTAFVFLLLEHSGCSFIYMNFMFPCFNSRYVQHDILQYYLSAYKIVKKNYRGADKSLVRPGRKQATATEDFEFHICYL